jgi:hypothetical protein
VDRTSNMEIPAENRLFIIRFGVHAAPWNFVS